MATDIQRGADENECALKTAQEHTPDGLFDYSKVVGTWKNRGVGGFGSREMWDACAADYAVIDVPKYGQDPFLDMLAEEVPLAKNMSVLDIGCGSGVYGIALAPRVGKVLGCDFSPRMVEVALVRAREEGCTNLSFEQGDFRSMTFPQTFDLVFAHQTPAICDGETFEKMMSLSRGWCYIAKPVRRTDFVLHEARRRAGIPVQEDARDEDFLCSFATVWLRGYTPTMRHYADVWDSEWPLEDACRLYCEQLVATNLDENQKRIVRDYLESIAMNGVVHEHIETTVAMMGWRVEQPLV